MTSGANQEGEDTGYMIKEYFIGTLNAELQPAVLKTVNAKRNAVDHKLLASSHDFHSKLHNFI
jgi:hypothetical protein